MSQKINAIVFSKDRAAQLKLFLDSVNKHASGAFDLNIIISYTDDDFYRGYDKVINNPKFKEFNFVKEDKNFKDQVLSLIKSDSDYTCFFLDDDLLYGNINFNDITHQLDDDEDVVCFSLRLGENVTKCYTLGVDNVMHDIKCDGDIMKWDWKLHYLDFGYPFAMNGHVFRKKDIYKLVRKSKFTGVDELEMALFDFSDTFPRNLMTSYKKSKLVNVPLGRVQTSIDNEMTMTLKNIQARKARVVMNEQLVRGDAPNFDDIEFLNIEGCHQEIDVGFVIDLEKSDLGVTEKNKEYE